MHKTTPWSLLRAGKAEQQHGLKQLQRLHARDRNASTIMELGVAYLWLYEYQHGWEHFCQAIKEFPIKGDAFYGMGGVAKWCLGDPVEAVSQWRAGLQAKYARASGLGIIMPLLLFFASVLRPKIISVGLGKNMMLEKVKDPRIETWPGPIAKLVLGQIDENEFRKHCRGTSQEDTRDRQWLTELYLTLMRYEQTGLSTFTQSMRKLTDTTQPEWSEDVLLGRIWHEEFFLARHEAMQAE